LYRKESDDPSLDLVGEGERLVWLRAHGIPAAEVVECRPGLLVTAEVPGRSGADAWPTQARPRVVDGMAELTRMLHELPVDQCRFDRRLAVTLPEALVRFENDAQRGIGAHDQVARLLATVPTAEDLVVCHGDLCLPNVLFSPDDAGAITGVIDAGRLGVADRWVDLALATRSMTSRLNPQYGEWAAQRYLARYGTAADPAKNDFYRLLDEFA
jgi:aminoglycoside phosphotransferase